MKNIRNAKSNDKEEFKALWNISFTDSLEFRTWFFNNRFVPEYSICMEEDNKIVSEVQSIPYFIKIRDSIVPSTMMVGACTHPSYTKRGYMKELYIWYMNYIRSLDVVICAHTPAVLKTYFYVGHLPVSDTAFIEIENPQPVTVNGVTDINAADEASALLKCYYKAVQKYSGVVLRTFNDMRLKCLDYMSDGGKAIAVWENGEIVAYGIYYDTSEMLYGEEIISLSAQGEQRIVDALINLGSGKKVKIKLPPDTKSRSTQGTFTVVPRNVLGLANAPKLLKLVGNNHSYSIEVFDDVVQENNGVFNFKGEKSEAAPAFKISAGNLMQWLIGYKSIFDLQTENAVEIFNKEEADILDMLFPKQACHIIDEY